MTASASPAVVLATRPMGEADLLVVLLTPASGKIRCAARQARRSRKRFAGGLPGGAVGEARVQAPRQAGGLWRLDEFRSLLDVSALGRDLERFAYVAYLCELTDALLHEPEADPHAFAALVEALAATLDAPPHPGVLRRYELRLLDGLGWLPSLDRCCLCGATEHEAPFVGFELERGGPLCARHGAVGGASEGGCLALAHALLGAVAPASDAFAEFDASSAEKRRALRDLTARLIRTHVRQPLRSLDFFAQIHGRSTLPDRARA